MWKKILWAAAALYPISMALTIIASAGSDQSISRSISGFLIFMVPLGMLIFELRDGKVSKFWQKLILFLVYLGSLFLLGVATAGYYSFNTPTPFNLVKGLPMLIMLFALFPYAFKRIFKRKAKA